jgi:transposase-like protein
MKRRTWDATAPARIVREGLQGKPGAALCHEHPISQRQYAQGRDHLLATASQAFESPHDAPQEVRLARENARLQTLVGELTGEVNKSDEGLG